VDREEFTVMQMVATGKEGNTNLHSAVLQTLQSGDANGFLQPQASDYESAQVGEQVRQDGYTVLGLAVKNFDRKCVQYMLSILQLTALTLITTQETKNTL
jgi:hypothetical protein